MENKCLGALIKEERQKRNITQAELGRRIGLKASRSPTRRHSSI